MSYTQIDRNMVVDFAPAPSTSSAPTYRVYSSTPMIMDVKAVEYLYGAESVSDGDSTYTFTNDSTRLQPIMMKTLIDSGGNDTIDASNQSRANTINLNPGTFSTIGLYTGGLSKLVTGSQPEALRHLLFKRFLHFMITRQNQRRTAVIALLMLIERRFTQGRIIWRLRTTPRD